MAFGGFDQEKSSAPMAEINMIPLIDVMLVLLVIFIITAPLLTHAVKIDLPKAESQPNVTKPQNVQLAIDAQGVVFWNGEPVANADMRQRMRVAAAISPQPELHLHVDQAVRYGVLAEVMSDAAKAGLTRIGFVTDPSPKR